MDYESIIRNSNTIFSTMRCKECGSLLYFCKKFGSEDLIRGYCKNEDCENCGSDDEIVIDIDELCAIINHNGINQFIQAKFDEKVGFTVQK